MASTGFWPVKSRLKEVLAYAENPDKTTDRKYVDDDLWAALHYAENKDKTDQTMYVSGINCIKQRAYECMMATKKRFGKLGGNVAYHGFQSFKTGEVTPEEAHCIGVSTARRMWGSEYEILVTTHLNTDNIHNHFVVNSVSFKTGKKFENHIRDHVELRKISDEVCKEHGKSVIPFTHFYGNKKEYWVKQSGNISHRQQLKIDLDEALTKCCSFRAMEVYLEALGYRFERNFTYAHASVIADGWKRPIRISSLGEAYSKEKLEDRFYENSEDYDRPLFKPPQKKRTPLLTITASIELPLSDFTLRMVYEVYIALIQYCKELQSQNIDVRPLSPSMREEMEKLDRYIEDYELLSFHKIETVEQLLAFQENVHFKIEELEQERYKLRLKIRRAKTPEIVEDLKQQAKEITKRITPLRKQFKSTLRIAERSPGIRELLQLEEAQERKVLNIPQRNRNERIRY